MILTGPAIVEAHKVGDVAITPFSAREVNPNSYNFRLSPHLIKLRPDGTGTIRRTDVTIPEDGYILTPGALYLGATEEKIGSRRYATTLLGRSSIGRLGVFLNVTADLGHVGSCSNWTLEISVVQPVRLFSRMRIGQVAFWHSHGPTTLYDGQYAQDCRPEPSKDTVLRLDTVGDEK